MRSVALVGEKRFTLLLHLLHHVDKGKTSDGQLIIFMVENRSAKVVLLQ
jgi:hypothetical protein